jgi:hypothetical protein
MSALTQSELDATTCGNPDCPNIYHPEIVLNATCHPRMGLEVAYVKATGTLVLRCILCDQFIDEIAVAP